MKIETHLRDDEMMVTPIAFAEAVIACWMGNCDTPEVAVFQRRGMGEMVDHLVVFCQNHPLREYEEMICQDMKHGN